MTSALGGVEKGEAKHALAATVTAMRNGTALTPCAAAADNDRIEVAAVLSPVQPHPDILREDLVVLRLGCPVFSVDGSGRAPLGRTVFLATAVIAAGR